MTTVIINGKEYQQTMEDGKTVLFRENNGFKIKTIFSGTKEDEEEFKRFVVDMVCKAWLNNEPWILKALKELNKNQK